jgi:hypothetical protein
MMTRFALVLVLFNMSIANAQTLAEYRWTHRLVLVLADSDDRADVVAFRESLRDARCELDDRDILVGWFFPGSAARIDDRDIDERQAQTIRDQFLPGESGMVVLLVGKDGGIKARYDRAPSLDALFALIDGMPVRRAEMRSRQSDCEP